jgi:lipopolysaccharide transport system permease protein
MAAVVIEPTRGWRRLRFRELWESRELLWFLTWRDVKIRYKQTAFGAAWAVLQPLGLMVIFAVFLGRLAKWTSGSSIPYPLFVYAGLVPWTFFSQGLSTASLSLVNNQNMVSKVYFPRLFLPLASIGSYLLDLSISLGLLFALMGYYGIAPGVKSAWVPVFILFAIATLLAVSILLAAITVRYRDVKYAIAVVLQAWLFLSPIIYPVSRVPASLRMVYWLNPMAGVIAGFRWSLLGGPPPGAMIGVSAAVTVVVLAFSLWYFHRTERDFADII